MCMLLCCVAMVTQLHLVMPFQDFFSGDASQEDRCGRGGLSGHLTAGGSCQDLSLCLTHQGDAGLCESSCVRQLASFWWYKCPFLMYVE